MLGLVRGSVARFLRKQKAKSKNNDTHLHLFDFLWKEYRYRLPSGLDMFGDEEKNQAEEVLSRLKAYNLCREYLHGAWKTLDESDFVVKRLSGGLSNHIFKCSLPKHMKPFGREPAHVLLRLYGQPPAGYGGELEDSAASAAASANNASFGRTSASRRSQDDHLRRVIASHVVDNVVFTILSERGLGPILYGVFPEGRLEQFIEARSMAPAEVRRPSYSAVIARKMAKIHSLTTPISKESKWLERTFNQYIDQMENISLDAVDPGVVDLARPLLTFDFRSEVEWLKKYLTRVHSPVVFCHNDVQGGNVLLSPQSSNSKSLDDRIVLIDYEFCGYNFRGFDIANHFCEWVYDYTNEEFPYYFCHRDNFPSKDRQVEFFHAYLSASNKVIAAASAASDESQNGSSAMDEGEDAATRPRTRANSMSSVTMAQEAQRKTEVGGKGRRGAGGGGGGRLRHMSSEQHTEILFREVQAFMLAPMLLWCMWGIVHSTNEKIPFGYWHYATDRMQDYLDHKARMTALMPRIPEASAGERRAHED